MQSKDTKMIGKVILFERTRGLFNKTLAVENASAKANFQYNVSIYMLFKRRQVASILRSVSWSSKRDLP